MKKLFSITALLILLTAGTAFAVSKAQENAGCGLGASVIKETDTLIGQLAMTFLNGISGNQTFGITSGTSECKQPSRIVQNERLNEFVVANMDTLARDIATGYGESLDTLAELMGISKEMRPVVYSKLKNNFEKIFTSEKVEAADVIDNIVSIINS